VRIRQLNPGAAWNEAERRAIPFGFVGFFLAGIIAAFGLGLGIKTPFLAGVCGATGFFTGTVGFFVGIYRNKLVPALIGMLFLAVLPWVITAFLFPWIGTGKLSFVPSIVVGIGMYFILHRLHLRLSDATLTMYLHQLAYDEHGTPKAGWQRTAFWLLAGLGAATILTILSRR